MKMAACVHDFLSWCASKCLKLNATKTELKADCMMTIKERMPILTHCSISPSDVMRDLDVLLDCRLSMTQHVSSTARTCLFHLCRIRQVKCCLDETCRGILVQALVIS